MKKILFVLSVLGLMSHGVVHAQTQAEATESLPRFYVALMGGVANFSNTAVPATVFSPEIQIGAIPHKYFGFGGYFSALEGTSSYNLLGGSNSLYRTSNILTGGLTAFFRVASEKLFMNIGIHSGGLFDTGTIRYETSGTATSTSDRSVSRFGLGPQLMAGGVLFNHLMLGLDVSYTQFFGSDSIGRLGAHALVGVLF